MKHAAPLLAAALLLAACDGGTTVSPPPTPPTQPPTQAEYLRENAVRVRTLDLSDTDFSDLEGLKAMIGDARVVSLGEATHGDGATFRAKARLVRFLHQEMGFDVIAWESGFWDVRKAWEWVEAGEPVVPSLQRGIFGVWTRSAQVAPLLEYVAAARTSARPIAMVGVDMQFSGATGAGRAAMHLAGDLRALLESHGSAAAEDPRFATFAAGIPHMLDDSWLFTKPSAGEQAAYLESVAFLRGELERLDAAGAEGLAYWIQLMESVAENAKGLWIWTDQGTFTERLAYTNLRDRQMGRNLAWYARGPLAGRKIIVWAATSHVVRNRAAIQSLPAEEWMSLGDHAHATFGNDMYVIGFTSYDGAWANAGAAPNPLDPPPAGSLEARFVEAGIDMGVVDLRNPARGGEWLQGTITSRPQGHFPQTFTWSQSLDAIMFIRTMTPSTQWVPGI